MAQVAEASYGVTPATPAFKPIRINSTTLGLSKNTFRIRELRSDRNTADLRHGTMQVGGDIVSELSFGSFDDQLEALLCGTWAENVLLNGVERRSFSVLRHFGDIGKADKPYHLLTGCEYNTLNLQVTTEAIVQATFGIVGKGLALLAAARRRDLCRPHDHGADGFFTGSKAARPFPSSPKSSSPSKTAFRPNTSSAPRKPSGLHRAAKTGQVSAYSRTVIRSKNSNEASSSLVFTPTDGEAGIHEVYHPQNQVHGRGQPDGATKAPSPYPALFQALLSDSAAGGALKSKGSHTHDQGRQERTGQGPAPMESFSTRENANEGIELPLLLPDGTKTEHWLRIRGVDADGFRKAEARSKRKMLEIAAEKDLDKRDAEVRTPGSPCSPRW